MSIIPPNAIILSKMKYLIKERYPEKCDDILEMLGPFPTFILYAEYRDIKTGVSTEFEDIHNMIDNGLPKDCDDIDVALNMLTRLKTKIKEQVKSVGIVRVMLKFNLPTFPDGKFSDLYLDEYPINMDITHEAN